MPLSHSGSAGGAAAPPTASASPEQQQPPAAPLYLAAQRWRNYLLAHSLAFRRLHEERERGWKSAALDAWYAGRQASPSATTTTTTVNDGSAGTTSFVTADVTALAERYRQHARRITQQAAPHFFRAVPAHAAGGTGMAAPPPPLFLDLGCAPGGVSKYLVHDLGWRGVGVSLSKADGGIDVDPALLHPRHAAAGDSPFVLLDGDVTQPPLTWQCAAAVAHPLSGCPSPDIFRTPPATAAPRFRFVNGGAVLDHGQRQRWDKLEEAAAAGGDTTEATAPTSGTSTAVSILPWFSLLVPQLQTALAFVEGGGALMLVHGAPHCASLFILLRCMEAAVGAIAAGTAEAEADKAASTAATAAQGARAPCRAHVLETMHLAKPPVYVLWTHVQHAEPSDGNECAGAETRRAAQACLIESLHATTPRVSPLSCHAASAPSVEGPALLEAKQRLWLGESEEGFQLAVEGFERYGHLVEAVWGRVEVFLRQRRERAEREMGSRSLRKGSGGRDAGKKRMRSDG